MTKKDNDKIVDFRDYLAEKDFEELLQSELVGFSDEELDELYDDLAFGEEFEDIEGEAALGKMSYQTLRDLERTEAQGHDSWLASEPVGWINLDERPYLSTKIELAVVYKQSGLYQKALTHFLEIYNHDEGDRLGTRYELMAIYVLTSNHKAAKALFASQLYYRDDLMMVIPMIIANILAGNDQEAKTLLDGWLFRIEGLKEFCKNPVMPMDEIMEAGSLDAYQPNSMTAVYVSLSTFLAILIPSSHYIMSVIHEFLEFETGEPFVEDLAVLNSAQIETLYNLGIVTLQDLKEWTEKEFLAIPKMGPATLRALKEKGVVFQS